MLKRKMTTFINDWIHTKDKKCLVVQGARQTGKTYIIERFAEENYEEIVEINFKQMPSAMEIFNGDLIVDNMVMAMKDFSLKQRIVENTLEGNSKGGIYECAIADALYKKGYPLYFYKNETTKKEIDIMIQKDGKVVPIEVKSGNTRANSLKALMKNKRDISCGYKFADGNIGVGEDGIITLPLYMAAFI